jgi:hypothetical protein
VAAFAPIKQERQLLFLIDNECQPAKLDVASRRAGIIMQMLDENAACAAAA